MCDVLMRFSEFYESPEYKGKNFKRKTFLRWFNKKHKKKYHNCFSGFNIPSYAFDAQMFSLSEFSRAYFGDWGRPTKSEENLIKFFKNFKDKFYVIGTNQKDGGVVKHETCHALFYLNSSYRKAALNEIKKHDMEAIKIYLKSVGYCDGVLLDEINAYMCCGEWDYLSENKDVQRVKKIYKKLHLKLDKLFNKYSEKDLFSKHSEKINN